MSKGKHCANCPNLIKARVLPRAAAGSSPHIMMIMTSAMVMKYKERTRNGTKFNHFLSLFDTQSRSRQRTGVVCKTKSTHSAPAFTTPLTDYDS